MTFKDMLSHNKVVGSISYFQEKGLIVSHILYEIIHIGRNNGSLINFPVIIPCDKIEFHNSIQLFYKRTLKEKYQLFYNFPTSQPFSTLQLRDRAGRLLQLRNDF